MSGSFSSGLLDSLAHPAQVNYLDVVNKSAYAANLINAARKTQAEQLAGQAAQNAITNGVFDPVANRANLANAGPAAALAVPEALKTTSQLSTDQLAQASSHNGLISQYSAPLIRNPSDANVNAMFDTALNDGLPPSQVEATRQRFLAMPPADRQQLAYHLGVGALTALDRIHRQAGDTTTQTGPGGMTVPVTTLPAAPGQPASVTQGAGGAQQGMTPGEMNTETPVYVPDPNNPGTYVQTPQPRYQRPGVGIQPPAPQGVPQPGTVPIPAQPGVTPGRVRPPPGSPLLNPPPAATGAPQTGAGATPSPTPAAATPPLLAPPQGQPAALQANQEAYRQAQTDLPNIVQNVQVADTARQALALATTGKGTEDMHNIYSFLKARGIPTPYTDDVKNYDIARKSLLQLAQSSGQKLGSDLGLETAIHSNASVDIDKDAALHLLNQQTGWMNQKIAMYHEAPDLTGIGFKEHAATFNGKTAPEAFAWDRYTPAQQAAITAQYTATGKLDMLDKSLEIAHKHGLINVPSKPAASTAPAATPTRSASNPTPASPPARVQPNLLVPTD